MTWNVPRGSRLRNMELFSRSWSNVSVMHDFVRLSDCQNELAYGIVPGCLQPRLFVVLCKSMSYQQEAARLHTRSFPHSVTVLPRSPSRHAVPMTWGSQTVHVSNAAASAARSLLSILAAGATGRSPAFQKCRVLCAPKSVQSPALRIVAASDLALALFAV